jgi:chaperonin GroEL
VDGESFGVIGGGGDPRQLRRHIAEQRAAFDHAKDKDIRQRIQKRLGKLMGGSATLWVGGATAAEIEVRKEMAQRASDLLRGAVREGVVPGGGVCLLSCRPALQQLLDQSTDEDECAAYRILIRAMETPIRTIIANAGFDPSEVMAEVKLAGLGYGFDVNAEQVVDVAQAGIFDVAAAQKAAARTAIIGAALALTVDVVVHRRKVPRSLNP